MAETAERGGSIGVVIADDQPLLVGGILDRVRDESGVRVLATTGHVGELVALVGRLRPDVVLSELVLDGGSLLDALPAISDAHAATRVLVLSASHDGITVARALEAGAYGFVSKHTDTSLLPEHLQRVAIGETVLDRHASEALAKHVRSRAGGPLLSPRELEVLEHVAKGETNRAIAAALFVAPSTVKTHLDRIFEKLRVRSRAAALAAARDARLLP